MDDVIYCPVNLSTVSNAVIYNPRLINKHQHLVIYRKQWNFSINDNRCLCLMKTLLNTRFP